MSEAKVISISPKGAWELVQSDPRAVLVDVRSTMEHLFVGHPAGSVHVPWIDEPDWQVNPHFVTQVRMLLLGGATCHEDDECAPVILICRSGRRSQDAGELLINNGFLRVFNVDTGFEGNLDDHHHRSTLDGWRHDGLPWEQC